MRTSRLLVLAPALALAGCDLTTGDASLAPTEGLTAAEVDCGGITPDLQIYIVDFAYEPNEAAIAEGAVVRWTNVGMAPHTVTSGMPENDDAGALFDSGDLGHGDSYCLEFAGRGVASYFCDYHPMTMRDAVIAVSSNPEEDDRGGSFLEDIGLD